MSVFAGPYTTIAPAPTLGALPIVERANTSSLPSGGGGGGSVGPNPVVSSITLGGQNPVVNMADGGLFFTTNGFDTTSTIAGIDYNSVPPSGSGIGGPDFTEIQAGTLNTYPVLDLALGGDGRMLLTLNSTMSIVGDSVNISSLVCSTINGVVPGAAVIPGDLALSTLTMGIPGGITAISSLQGAGGVLPIVGTLDVLEIKNVSSINGALPAGGGAPPAEVSTILTLTNLSTINNGTPQLLLIAGDVGLSGGGLTASGNISTNTLTNFSGNSISLAAPSTIIKNNAVVNGDLGVSSINGAAYPPAGAALKFSTIGIPGGVGSTTPINPGITTQVVAFSTIAGHTYSASVYARATTNGNVPAAPGDMLYTEILDNNTGNDGLGSWLTSEISTMASNGTYYKYVGGTTNWKAGGTGAAFAVFSNTSSLIYMDGLNVIDYGAI